MSVAFSLDEQSFILQILTIVCREQHPASSDSSEALFTIFKEIRTMSDRLSSELSQLQSDVAAQTSVIASATTAFQGLAAQLAAAEAAAKEAGASDAQIAGFVAARQTLEGNTAALAGAIPQNTPAQDPNAGAVPQQGGGETAPAPAQ